MKPFQKLLTLVCAMAILLCSVGIFSGCNKKEEESAQTSSTAQTTTPSNPDPGFDYETGDRLDPTLWYDNTPFNIYAWNNTYTQEWVQTLPEKPTEVESTLYQHVKSMDERLGLQTKFEFVNGNWDSMNEFLKKLESYILVNESAYDLVCQYSLTASAGAVMGLYRDIADWDSNVDFEAPWWNETLVSGNTMNGKLYYITGDLTASVIYNMSACIFNKDLLAARNIEEPYELVRTGVWTWDQLLELVQDTAENPNREGIYTGSSEQVMYGLHIYKGAVDFLHTSSGILSVEKKDDQWGLSSDFIGTRTVDMVDKIRKIVWENEDVFYDKNQKYVSDIFKDEKCLFTLIGLNYVEKFIRDEGLKVGVVPLPKYDVSQEQYYTRLGQTYSMFTLPRGADVGKSTAVLEALGSNGYKEVTPEIFDEIFCSRYAADPADGEMFRLIKESILYDPGYTAKDLSVFSAVRNCVYENKSWKTYLDSRITHYSEELEILNSIK